MKLVARSADDEVLLLFCEVGGENLDSLDEVVDLNPWFGGPLRGCQLEQRTGLKLDHLDLGTRIGGQITSTENFQDGNTNESGRGHTIVDRNTLQVIGALVASDEEGSELVPDLLGVLELGQLDVVGRGSLLGLAGGVLDNDDRDIT